VAGAQTAGIGAWLTDGCWASTGRSWMKMGAGRTATMAASGVADSSLADRSATLLLTAHGAAAPSTRESPTGTQGSKKVMNSKICSYRLSWAGEARSYRPVQERPYRSSSSIGSPKLGRTKGWEGWPIAFTWLASSTMGSHTRNG
jgi:hypothetical protein